MFYHISGITCFGVTRCFSTSSNLNQNDNKDGEKENNGGMSLCICGYFKFLIVSPDESRGYLGFSTVTPPPQRFPFGRDNLKNILVRPFKFGMWVQWAMP